MVKPLPQSASMSTCTRTRWVGLKRSPHFRWKGNQNENQKESRILRNTHLPTADYRYSGTAVGPWLNLCSNAAAQHAAKGEPHSISLTCIVLISILHDFSCLPFCLPQEMVARSIPTSPSKLSKHFAGSRHAMRTVHGRPPFFGRSRHPSESAGPYQGLAVESVTSTDGARLFETWARTLISQDPSFQPRC